MVGSRLAVCARLVSQFLLCWVLLHSCGVYCDRFALAIPVLLCKQSCHALLVGGPLLVDAIAFLLGDVVYSYKMRRVYTPFCLSCIDV